MLPRGRYLVAVSAVTVVLYAYRTRYRLSVAMPSLALFAAMGLSLGLPALLPNLGGYQLGPRYLLVWLAPAVLAACVLGRRLTPGRLQGTAMLVVFCALSIAGSLQNFSNNLRELSAAYEKRSAPALAFLRQRGESVVAVSTGAITFDLATAMESDGEYGGKAFVLVRSPKQWRQLASAWPADLPRELLYVSWVPEPERAGEVPPDAEDLGVHGRHFRFFRVGL